MNGSRNLLECILTKCAQYTISTHTVQSSMFNSTHTFVGLAIARTGLDDWVPRAAITAVISSNFSDIDIITAPSSTSTYLEYHPGITPTFFGVRSEKRRVGKKGRSRGSPYHLKKKKRIRRRMR